jgi:hypothetical protein
MSELSDSIKAFSESNIVNMRVKYGEKNEEKSLDEMITTCDICGKIIVGVNNFINAGDKVVCSDDCLHKAIGEFRHWENTLSHNWTKP